MSPGWLLGLALMGCGGPSTYGAAEDVAELKAQAVAWEASLPEGGITVDGEIGEVCPLGCWFYLLGAQDMVYVELDLASGFVIPKNSKGKRAVVRGTVQGTGAERRLKAGTVVVY